KDLHGKIRECIEIDKLSGYLKGDYDEIFRERWQEAEQLGYIYHMLSDSDMSKWLRAIQHNVRSIGMPLESILLFGQHQAYRALSQRLNDIEKQELLALANRTCSPQ
ncbi:hypothetical protein JRQ81_016798, partial [Phrynocephalus forsythii]